MRHYCVGDRLILWSSDTQSRKCVLIFETWKIFPCSFPYCHQLMVLHFPFPRLWLPFVLKHETSVAESGGVFATLRLTCPISSRSKLQTKFFRYCGTALDHRWVPICLSYVLMDAMRSKMVFGQGLIGEEAFLFPLPLWHSSVTILHFSSPILTHLWTFLEINMKVCRAKRLPSWFYVCICLDQSKMGGPKPLLLGSSLCWRFGTSESSIAWFEEVSQTLYAMMKLATELMQKFENVVSLNIHRKQLQIWMDYLGVVQNFM